MSVDLKDRVDNIKAYVKVLDLIKDYGLMPYESAGIEFQMKCPFHGKDNKPSAHVYDAGATFKCFTCHRYYDVVRFFMEKEGVDFKNAMYLLEKRYNIPKLQNQDLRVLKDEHEKKQQITAEMLCGAIEKQLLQNKFKYGLEKYAKLFYILDTARKKDDLGLAQKLQEKMKEY